jgi:hypothetical protein
MTNADLQRAARVALTLALAAYGISYASDPGAGRLIDGVDLAIHESGHLVFGAFGVFCGQLFGGSCGLNRAPRTAARQTPQLPP